MRCNDAIIQIYNQTEQQAQALRHATEVAALRHEIDRASGKLVALQEQLNDAIRDRDLQRQSVAALTHRFEALQVRRGSDRLLLDTISSKSKKI